MSLSTMVPPTDTCNLQPQNPITTHFRSQLAPSARQKPNTISQIRRHTVQTALQAKCNLQPVRRYTPRQTASTLYFPTTHHINAASDCSTQTRKSDLRGRQTSSALVSARTYSFTWRTEHIFDDPYNVQHCQKSIPTTRIHTSQEDVKTLPCEHTIRFLRCTLQDTTPDSKNLSPQCFAPQFCFPELP